MDFHETGNMVNAPRNLKRDRVGGCRTLYRQPPCLVTILNEWAGSP